MQPIGTNATLNNMTMLGGENPSAGLGFGVVCLSDCLSDWDKQKKPVTNSCSAITCDGRQSNERRGQDSNLRTSYPVTDLANPRFRPLSHLSVAVRDIVLSVASASNI